jgi:hypothetical protein
MKSMAYLEWTVGVSITGTTAAAAQTIVTAPGFTADGTSAYIVEFYAPGALPVASGSVALFVEEAGVNLGEVSVLCPAAGTLVVPLWWRRRLVPAAGTRTYIARAYGSASGGAITAGAGGAGTRIPGYIRVTRSL